MTIGRDEYTALQFGLAILKTYDRQSFAMELRLRDRILESTRRGFKLEPEERWM